MTFRASRTKLLFIGMAVFREERGLPRRQRLKSRQTLDYLTLVYFSARPRFSFHYAAAGNGYLAAPYTFYYISAAVFRIMCFALKGCRCG